MNQIDCFFCGEPMDGPDFGFEYTGQKRKLDSSAPAQFKYERKYLNEKKVVVVHRCATCKQAHKDYNKNQAKAFLWLFLPFLGFFFTLFLFKPQGSTVGVFLVTWLVIGVAGIAKFVTAAIKEQKLQKQSNIKPKAEGKKHPNILALKEQKYLFTGYPKERKGTPLY